MKLKPIESEMLLVAGYDPKSFILHVVFRTGDHIVTKTFRALYTTG
ncbi:MAG TPA: hypothetical protein VFT08_01965 [Pyrinomonadaceae bacterium]|nr:hypothetical protein [Pyrinomonadaceae bacterium]